MCLCVTQVCADRMFYLFKRLVCPADSQKCWWLAECDDGKEISVVTPTETIWHTPIRKILDGYYTTLDRLQIDYILLQDNIITNVGTANKPRLWSWAELMKLQVASAPPLARSRKH